MLDFTRSLGRLIVAGVRWLYDHEPVRTGAAVQVMVGGLTAWLMAQADRLGLPNNIAEVLVGLVGAGILARVEEWKRSRVANAATAARLLNSPPPPVPLEPIPLAQEKAGQDQPTVLSP